MDRFLSMKIFVRIVQLGSFTAVAADMEMTQSSVSKRMAALEAGLGCKLIVRNSRKILLTEAGSQYYNHCLSILKEMDTAEAQVREYSLRPTGYLRVSLPDTFGRVLIVPFLPDFKKKYPDIQLDVSLMGHKVDMITEGIDIAVRIGNLEDSNLIARKIAACQRVIVASPGYLKLHGMPKSVEDLQHHQCLSFTKRKGFNLWHFMHQGKEVAATVNGVMKSSSGDVILECALGDLGIAVLPKWLVYKELEQGSLVTIMEEYQPLEYPVHALYPQNHFVPLKVRCFIEYYQQIFSQKSVLEQIYH
ncbi:LysR family transcriptional regulator [Thalassomonas viridans]|uniref:LysR family transcriptional regulator n=1 Tax=Thalassomonas viridans TaxID=137584 RepID=A0AAE9Z3L5_9GAMM|nr:LysR family transcriptional regulator [Thalassomonas viridans]WDE05943.1 LysR family transcriptional regulator [Thalassomonas viridans]